MRKLFHLRVLIITITLLVYQLIVPIGNIFVSANSSMLPPSNLAADNVTPDDVKLTWSSVFGATGYNVYEIKDGQITPLGNTTSTSYMLNDLEEGYYEYVVSTLSSEGESGPSAPVSAEVIYPTMEAPTNLTSTIKNGNDIVLSWNASQYTEKYNVYEISANNEKTLITSVTAETFEVINAAEGSYTYSVSAANSLYGESEPTNPIEIEVVHPTMTEPNNLIYSVTNGNDVTLKWDSVPYTTEYNVYQLINGEKELISSATSNTIKFSNVAAGEYTYVVHSNSDRFGESTEGSQVTVSVSSISMEAPANLTYSLQNINDVLLTWDSAAYATSYNVYQIIEGEKVLQSTVSGTSVKYTKLPGGDYVYEVYSYSDRFGESTEGTQVSFHVETVTMEAPEQLVYDVENGNDVILRWESASNADNYKIYQIINGEKTLRSTVSGTAVRYNNLPEGEFVYEVHSFSNRFGESAEGSLVAIDMIHPTMEAPANFTKTIKGASDFSLSWDEVPYASYYKIYQMIDGEKVLKRNVTGLTSNFTKMAPGEYTFIVHSYSYRFGESANGSDVSLTLTGLEMQAPTNLTHTITNGNDIRLNWTSVENANYYNVYQMIDGEKVLQKTVTGTYAIFSNQPEGEYVFKIHSYSTLFGESTENANLSLSLVHPTMEAPNEITYSISYGNDVILNWDSVQYANNYNVYEIVGEEKVFIRTVTNLATRISNVEEGEHTYIVHSESSRFGESPEGSQLSLTLVHPVMQAPENVTKTILNGNDILLRWEASDYATSYNVYRIVDGQVVLESSVTGTAVRFNNLPEDDYTYVIHSESSRFGESAEGSQIAHTLVHPVMQAPENVTLSIIYGNDILLKWDAASYATSYNIYQIIDGQPVLERTVTGTAVRLINMPEGEYTFVIRSESNRFGESAEGSQISHTLVHPIMQAPENLREQIVYGNDIILRWNASSYATAYNVYQIVDGELILVKTVSGTAVRFNNMPEGDYKYVVHSYSNRFDASPEGSLLDFTLIWPEVEAPQISGTLFNVNNITLTWPAADWANGYKVYQITNDERELVYEGTARSVKVYNLTEETHSFEVIAYSTRFGESKLSNRITETIVYPIMEPPTANLQLLSETSARITWNFITYANGYNIYEIIDGQPVLIVEKVNNLSYTINNLTYANHEYIVTSYSNSFGESDPSNVVLAKLILDTEAPVTTSDAPIDWVTEDQTITLSATDNETGVAKTFYSIDGQDFVEGSNFEVKGEGIHTVSFYSIDKVDNVEEVQTIEVKIDKSAPTVEMDLELEYSLGSALDLIYSAQDDLSGIEVEAMFVNDGNTVSKLGNGSSITLDKPGTYHVSIFARNGAGLTTEIHKEFVVYIPATIDVTAMVIKGNNGVFTVRVDLPKPFSTKGFDLDSVTVNGESALTSNKGYYNQAKNGQFKFNRSDFEWTSSEETLTFRGYVDGYLVVGQKTVKVKK